jgi:hypothetical protein
MGRSGVVEDADQDVDREKEPGPGEKDSYISGDSLVCAAPDDPLGRHLSSPLPADGETAA